MSSFSSSSNNRNLESALQFWNYGDSGAFPEYHIKQYPSGFGKTIIPSSTTDQSNNDNTNNNNTFNTSSSSSNKNTNNSLMIIQTTNSTLKASSFSADQLAKPDQETISSIEEDTRRQLELARQKTSTVSTGIIGSATSTTKTKKKTDVIQTEDGRTIAITEISRDVADPRKMRLQKTSNLAENNDNSAALVLAHNNNDGALAAPLIRSPTKKITGQDAKAFAVPSAVYAHRNPKSKLISAEERAKHTGSNYIEHNISDKHAEAAKAVMEATRRADREEEQRKKDEEAERERRKEEDRKKLEAQAKASLLSQMGRNTSGDHQQQHSSGGGAQGLDDYEQRSREMDQKRKLRQFQKTAERLGVNVEDFLAQDDDDIAIIETDTKKTSGMNRGGGNYDSRLNQFMTSTRNTGNATRDASTLGYDTGLFQTAENTNSNSDGGAVTLSSVMNATNRDKLLQEQMVQETIRAQQQQQQNQQQQPQEQIITHEDGNGDDDEDVFGVDDLM